MAHVIKSVEINGQTLSIETGKIAKQAGGSIIIRMGDSMVLVATTGNEKPSPGRDFLPLTCEYRPMAAAAGHDVNYEALSGLLWLGGDKGGRPPLPTVPTRRA